MKKHDFRGKNVLITGASSGIGRALAVEFAKRGAKLGLCALPREKRLLSTLSDELKSTYGTKTWLFPVDLLAPKGPEKLFDAAKKEMKSIYTLVNNAGTVAYGKVWEIDWELQQRTLELNLSIPIRLMYLFLPGMVKRGKGVIFNTSSVSALQPTPFHSVYGATKAGLQSISEGIRTELRGTGVSVCTLNPPYTDTALLQVQGFPKEVRWYSISGLATPQWVAKKAIRAFERGKFLYVPGVWAKFIHLFLIKISPRWLVNFLSYFSLQGKKGGEIY
jgi:short-subunit dehydrogenase